MVETAPRAMCFRCMRPASVCYCGAVPRIVAKTPVVLLQHPRERFMPIGTARMASLCLDGSALVVGTELDRHPVVRAALDDRSRTPILLWPGPTSRDLATHPPEGPTTLVVVDGTWSLAKKLVRLNPRIAALPQYSLVPSRPSEYRIRAEPAAECVSTIEAVIEALSILEGDRSLFEPMMTPFRRMIDAQIEHAERTGGRGRHRKLPRPPRPRPVPTLLRSGRSIVVVVGEANAWPYAPARHPDELVQWLAVRLDDGARFERIVRPRMMLSPTTTKHTRLDEATILGGVTFERLAADWRAFVRDDDVVVSWGPYAASLMKAQGGFLPADFVDLRRAAFDWLRDKTGNIVELAERLGLEHDALGTGRGGARLGTSAAVARFLGQQAPAPTGPLSGDLGDVLVPQT
jgi:DTW domain-containing protein YfiP